MRRIPELDALRGLAALAVVATHALPDTFRAGQLGVELFFVLSGFLITSIILTDRNRPGFLRDFYVKRLLRIWPVYFLTLFAVVALASFTRSPDVSAWGLAQHLTFTQRTPLLPAGSFPLAFSPSWTVSVEEQFYLVWPLLLVALGPRSVPAFAGLLLSAGVATRAAGWSHWPILTRGDGLALGCLLGWLLFGRNRRTDPTTPTAAVACGAAVLFGLAAVVVTAHARWGLDAAHLDGTGYVTGSSLLFAGVVGACVVWTGRPWLAVLRFAPFARLGTISYALYLTHLPVMFYTPAVLSRLGSPSWSIPVAVWALVFAVPIASWFLVERPVMRLRRRLLTRSRPATIPA